MRSILNPRLSRIAAAGLFALALIGVGCYESQFVLADASTAKIDTKLIGTWKFEKVFDSAVTMVVKDLDGKQYDVDWIPEGKEAGKLHAYLVEVKGVTFAEVRAIENGKPEEKAMIMRVVLDGDKLALSNLASGWFDTHPVTSNETLRAAVEAGVNDQAMYDDELMIAERQK